MATIYDTANYKVVDNEVLETKIENQLITKLNMNQFITVDNSLTEAPGMVKKVRTYKGTGTVEDLEMGEGNSKLIGAEFDEKDYRVMTTQGHTAFYDEQRMADPTAIDTGINRITTELTNDITRKVVGELEKTTKRLTALTFDGVVDAIAEYPDEEATGLYLLMAKDSYASLQKACKDQLKYVEDFVRSGYVGHLAGVPIYVSKAVANGQAYLASKDAITLFRKKGVEVENARDADHRKNDIFARDYKVIALTDATKAFKLVASANPDPDEGNHD